MRWFAWSFLYCFLLALSLSLFQVLLIYTICYVQLMIFIMAHSENGFLRKPRRKTQNRWSYDTYHKIINESLWPFYFFSLFFPSQFECISLLILYISFHFMFWDEEKKWLQNYVEIHRNNNNKNRLNTIHSNNINRLAKHLAPIKIDLKH